MNSVSENTTQAQSIHNSVQDDYDFLEEFARTELANTSTEQAITPADKCFDNEGYPVYENITAEDIRITDISMSMLVFARTISSLWSISQGSER